MKRCATLVVLSLSAMIASCQTAGGPAGGTPLTLTSTSAAALEWYRDTAEAASALAVSTDGTDWAGRHCQKPGCRPAAAALEDCGDRARSRGFECRLLARGLDIVWDGPVNHPTFGENGHLLSLTVDKTFGSGTVTYGGEATVRLDQPRILLSLRVRSSTCDGNADTDTKRWRIACPYSQSYEGSFTDGARSLYEGLGKSSSGRSARFAIFPKR